MNMSRRQHMRSALTTLGLVLSLSLVRAGGQTIQDPPVGRPDAVVDLTSHEGVQLVNGQWRYHDVQIVDADSRAVGPDLKPSGAPIRTYDYAPHAGLADYDDSQWEAIDATTLDQRRSTAKVCFNWYGINGPISYSPQNFIWIKSATLDFYKSPKVAISETPGQVTRKDPALDEIVLVGAKIEKLAGGFVFTEGPVWVPRAEDTDGYLLFSDPNNNLIYRWTQDGQLSIFMT